MSASMVAIDQQSDPERRYQLLADEFSGDLEDQARIVLAYVEEQAGDKLAVRLPGGTRYLIAISEFADGEVQGLVKGQPLEIMIMKSEGEIGERASRSAAVNARIVDELERLVIRNEPVMGRIVEKVRGGFHVQLDGIVAFMPAKQLDLRPNEDTAPLMGKPDRFRILAINRRRLNVVVSRRSVLEDERDRRRGHAIARLKPGDTVRGKIKVFTDYGAFVNLGDVDGLLHNSELAWSRIGQASEVLSIGEEIDVKIIDVKPDRGHVSLSRKQLTPDPFLAFAEQYPVGSRLVGPVKSVADYGVFVEVAPGVEGLVHATELSWNRKMLAPSAFATRGQQLEVLLLQIDLEKRRVSLSVKQLIPSPWQRALSKLSVGALVEGRVTSITELGLFIPVAEDIDGMVHKSALPAGRTLEMYQPGDFIAAIIVEIDMDSERIALRMK